MQVLALMNAANNSCSPTIIDYTEFYNMALDHMDLMKVFTLLFVFHSDHVVIKVTQAANLYNSKNDNLHCFISTYRFCL